MLTMFINSLLQAPGPNHFLFRDGKINTVAIVVLIIWGGTLLYLLLTDRKVSKLEKLAKEVKQKLDAKKEK